MLHALNEEKSAVATPPGDDQPCGPLQSTTLHSTHRLELLYRKGYCWTLREQQRDMCPFHLVSLPSSILQQLSGANYPGVLDDTRIAQLAR